MATGEAAKDMGADETTFECFGVRARVVTSRAEDLEQVLLSLPPTSRLCPGAETQHVFGLKTDSAGAHAVTHADDVIASNLPLVTALEVLERELRMLVARHAPEHIFVHSGAVGYAGKAIVLPGESFAGKTSLVAALVRAGATYYSDEYAVLDQRGFVHPFPKPLSLREGSLFQVDHAVETLGGKAGVEALPVGLVALTRYDPEVPKADWRPRRLTPGEAAVALLSHTVPARARPSEALSAITRSVEDALALEGPRGEASLVAPQLLEELENVRGA
jgi:hypothetical protein